MKLQEDTINLSIDYFPFSTGLTISGRNVWHEKPFLFQQYHGSIPECLGNATFVAVFT